MVSYWVCQGVAGHWKMPTAGTPQPAMHALSLWMPYEMVSNLNGEVPGLVWMTVLSAAPVAVGESSIPGYQRQDSFNRSGPRSLRYVGVEADARVKISGPPTTLDRAPTVSTVHEPTSLSIRSARECG